MSGGGHGEKKGGGIRKMVIVLLLVCGVILLHRFSVRTVGFDPTAMLSLGFVILASYAFGQIVGRIGLPHLTGYILAGMALGPHVADVLPRQMRLPPFDHGVLSSNVIAQLRPFEILAVALIALIAGGELKFAMLRRGFGSIIGMIGGHLLIVGPLAFAFIAGISGVIPGVPRLPGLTEMSSAGALAMAVVVGAVVISTSPAAAVAVVAETRSSGPLTGVVMGSVVLMDVVIVILFSVASTFAARTLGQEESGALGMYLLQHIGGSVVAGAIAGGVMILYLRFVKAELLLFLLGTVFAVSFVAQQLELEPVLLFIAAGFVVVNFSNAGEELVETVERLFLPVSVVFFTLAGARLHLGVLVALAPFAVSMVVLRAGGTFIGTRVGLVIARAPDVVRRLGWVGFVPQAGVALALAALVGRSFGELGTIFETLLVAGIALNELFGPVLLKFGLGAAREIGGADRRHEEKEEPKKEEEKKEEEQAPELTTWPAPEKGAEVWGPPLQTHSRELDSAVRDLSYDLTQLARDVAEEPLARFRDDALTYIRELRREFLRHHRRITVQASEHKTELSAAEALRLEQAELAEKWRTSVLARAMRVRQQTTWDPEPIVDGVEAVTETLPAEIDAEYEPETFQPHETDSFFLALARFWLRVRRGVRRIFGAKMAVRPVHVRALARYPVWGELPSRLEPVAALYTQAESHLVARTRSIFDAIVFAYDRLASDIEASRRAEDDARALRTRSEFPPAMRPSAELITPADGVDARPTRPPAREAETKAEPLSAEAIEERLREVRAEVEEELLLAVQEVDRIVEDVALRTSQALGASLRSLKEDATKIGTPDLSMRKRAASKLYKRREEMLRTLARGTAAGRETAAAVYNRLALEMELIALEGRVKDTLEDHATQLGKDVRGRAHRQVQRVHDAIVLAELQLGDVLIADAKTDDLARRVRELCEPVVRVSAEAARVCGLLRDQLTDDRSMTTVLDALTRAAQSLTDRYRIPAGPVVRGEYKLAPNVGTIDVPFREWVLARIETNVAPRLIASTREVAGKVEPLAQALSELERRIAFNVELALGELSVVDEEHGLPPQTKRLLREMIGGALERNRELFNGYVDASANWGEDVRAAVRDAVLSGIDELRSGLIDGDLGRLRFQMVRHVRGRRLARIVTELRHSLRRSWVIARRALREAIGETRIDRFRVRMGLPARLAEDDIRERTFDPKEPATSIPMVYRRLFSAQALEAGDILTGRDEALNRAMSTLEGREDKKTLRTVAIVGPDGVGKSAFINAVMRARRWPRVHELALEGPATPEEIDAFFEPLGEGHLVVVSGLHWLASIRPGGFVPLRRFVSRVVSDEGKNAFLVRADTLVWNQCSLAAPLAEAFPELVRLDPLAPQALEAAVLARHTVSGYGLVFSQGITVESPLEELVLSATAPLSRPQQSFFRALHAASGGLLRDALRLWLASVEEVDEAGDFVHLGPVPTPNIYALRRLTDADVLLLYQIARQGWMDAPVLASVYRTDETSAHAKLAALAHVGVLEKRRSVWRIAVHLRGSVHRLLRERGYVA